MAHPDLQISGGGGHPDPEIRGRVTVSKKFFQPFGPQLGLKIRGSGPHAPSLGSTTFVPYFWDLTLCDVECNDFFYPT